MEERAEFSATQISKERLQARWPNLESFTDYWFPEEVHKDLLFPLFLQDILIVLEPQRVEIPLVQRHVTTSWSIVSFKEGKPLLLPPFALGKRHFNIRAEIANHMLAAELGWVAYAVWGARQVDNQVFEEAAGLMYSPSKADKVRANWYQFIAMESDGRLGGKEAARIIETIGIRSESNWGKILLQKETGASNLLVDFPTSLKRLENAFEDLPTQDQEAVLNAFPVVVEYQTELPALLIGRTRLLRRYRHIIGEQEKDPRLQLPSTRGVEESQLIRFLCRKSDIERLKQLCSEKELAIPIHPIEEERKKNPEIFINTCTRRYGRWTSKDLAEGREDGRFLPLVFGHPLGKKGLYDNAEFRRFWRDWDGKMAERD